MSNALSAGTVDHVLRDGQNPQPASETEAIGGAYVPRSEISALRRVLDEAEVHVILRALQQTGWNRKRAAALLEISYRGLLYKIRRHSITPTTAPTTGR